MNELASIDKYVLRETFELAKGRAEKAESLAASRLELLKKIVEESFLDVENQTWYWSCSQIEFDELTKELG